MNEVVQEVIAITRAEMQTVGVTLRAHLSHDLPLVTGDRVQLQQLMLNLIMNALDAMHDVQDRPRELAISTRRTGADAIEVAVQDSGVGLDSQGKEKHHGGRLWAISNDGPGATFLFTIPGKKDRVS
jgi:signal transduction histidine kinase